MLILTDNQLHILVAFSMFGLIISIGLLFVHNRNRHTSLARIYGTKDQNNTVAAIKVAHPNKGKNRLFRIWEQTGIRMGLVNAVILHTVFTLIMTLIMGLFFNITIGIACGLLIYALSCFAIHRQIMHRRLQFEFQLSDAIQILGNAVKSGYSFMQALSKVVEECREPMQTPFKQLLKDMSLGKTMEESFDRIYDLFPVEDLALLTSALVVQKEIGGNLAQVLDNILETLRDRQSIAREIKTLTAQGKLSGAIILGLPIVLSLFLTLINPTYMVLLFDNPLGIIMVTIALVSQTLGIVMISNIVKVDY